MVEIPERKRNLVRERDWLFDGGKGFADDVQRRRGRLADDREYVMADNLTWDDYEELGELLYRNHPDVEPLNVRFPDLHDWVCDLDDFNDDPEASTDGKLEAIQVAWLEVWQDEQE